MKADRAEMLIARSAYCRNYYEIYAKSKFRFDKPPQVA